MIVVVISLAGTSMAEKKSLLQIGYYDKPDGEDLMSKLIYTNKWGIGGAVVIATHDAVLYTRTKGYLPTLARYVYWTAPAVAMVSTFTIGTFMSTRLREKDDLINYFVGSFGAGGVVGAFAKSRGAGLFAGVAFCFASWLKRLSREEGWEFFPEQTRGWGNFRTHKHDFTITSDPEPGWTRGN